MFLDKTASLKRLQETTSNKEEFVVINGSFPVNVQPANSETTILVEGKFGKTYRVYTTYSGIRDGDKLTVSGTFIDGYTQDKELSVSNVEHWQFGPIPHSEVVCIDFE